MKKIASFLFSVMLLAPLALSAQLVSAALLGSRLGGRASTTVASIKVSTVTGTAASINGTSLILSGSSSTSYTVDASAAKVYRKYGAAMQVSDIQTGDTLQVYGTINGTSITAKTIRDQSQQQKNGTFTGTVSSINGSSFALATKNRGDQTINTDSSSVFKENGQSSVSIGNVTVGENIIASGLWDSTANTVAASNVTIVVKNGTVTGILQSISGDILTVSPKNASTTVYTVDATNAKLIRRYGATMQLSDYQTGDTLAVSGIINGLNITAKTIRDQSQQQKNGTFTGTVSSINGSSFALATKNRGDQTINTDSSSVFKENGQSSVSIGNVTVGENIIASGLWDSTANTVAASNVTIVVKNGTVTGILQSISGDILTVSPKNASTTVYTVDATNAKLIRRYGATMQLSDYQTGDTLAVSGIINGLNITAKTIRDESLQAYNGTFTGSVTAVSSSSFTLQSKNRGSQTINLTSTTIIKVGTVAASSSAIAVGQTATVSGVWDRTASNVTANRVTIKVVSQTITGVLQAISGTALTVVNASSTSYSVDASKARVEFEHGHSGSLSTFQANDQVKVWGSGVSGSTSVTARIVQDQFPGLIPAVPLRPPRPPANKNLFNQIKAKNSPSIRQLAEGESFCGADR